MDDVEQMLVILVGAGAGLVFGLFGAGGTALATPMLALAGVPPIAAIASPLPAILPASVAGTRRSLKLGHLDRRVAALAVAGGLPGAVLGGLASSFVDGRWLVLASGVALLAVGARVLLPDPDGQADLRAGRRDRSAVVVALAFSVGVVTGLLANGGGFLLVPAFILVLGLTTGEAAGTSMVAVGILTIPTTLLHWSLGHIDWAVAAPFALGLLPASLAGSAISARLPADQARKAFGALLVVFAGVFLVAQVA